MAYARQSLNNRIPQWFIALAVLAAGVVNIVSVATPPIPWRLHFIRGIFPLLWVRGAHFLALLIGLVLIVGSMYIYRRKERAYKLLLVLSFASVFLHIAKAGDYEEAVFLLATASLLYATRFRFTVKSSSPSARSVVPKIALALGAVLLYGLVGFMYFGTHGSGREIGFAQALANTIRFATFSGDPDVLRSVRRMELFVEFLQALSVAAVVYGISVFFRPVLSYFSQSESERRRAQSLAGNFGNSSLDYFKVWDDKQLFFPHRAKVLLLIGLSTA